MRRTLLFFAVVAGACAGSTSGPTVSPPATSEPTPPVAERRDHAVESPHGTRNDPYYWLRDDTRTDAAVLDYIRAENAYTDAVLAPTKALQDTLFEELKERIVQDDSTVPVLDRGYWYYTRVEDGKQYPIHARRKGTMDAPEQILFDVNELADGHDYYKLASFRVSPDDTLVAYTEDTVGRNQYALRVMNLATRDVLPDTAANITASLEWAADSRTLVYVAKDPETLRSNRVFRHTIGATGEDALVYREADTAYYTNIATTKSRAYIAIRLSSTDTTEVRLIDAAHPDAAPVVFYPRETGHEYSIDHLDGEFVIYTNWQAVNYRAMTVAEADHANRDAWRVLVPHREDELLNQIAVYRTFYATSFRSGALRKVRVLPRSGEPFVIDADAPAYAAYLLDTPDADSVAVRYMYSSLSLPYTWYDVDVATRARTQLKQDQVRGGYDPNDYASELVFAPARDGAKIPVSIVYRKDTPRDGTAPMIQYGYGSYGFTRDPSFQPYRVGLLDRGFVYAIAHVRGSMALGRKWYEDGRQLAKKNTFTDFIDVTSYLVDNRYAAPDKVFAVGGSAGGLLVGAVVNMAPDKYRGAIANVPFVDIVTTMLDESIPLTSNEYDEWGNPADKAAYDYMLSYSPYDNVSAQGYPALLVTTGLWDSQVQYFEPAKWVAKLRATKTDANPLLLHTNMDAGHGGKSGRYDLYREIARNDAFVLWVLERPDTRPTN